MGIASPTGIKDCYAGLRTVKNLRIGLQNRCSTVELPRHLFSNFSNFWRYLGIFRGTHGETQKIGSFPLGPIRKTAKSNPCKK